MVAVSNSALYLIIIGALVLAFAACALLFWRKEEGVLGDPWYAPVILIMIWVSLQHIQNLPG
jgi:hypothetical protein